MSLELIRVELQRLADGRGGIIQATEVVEAARDDASPLHDQFDWDDSIAAREWRLVQARNLLRRVELVYQPPKGDTISYPMFTSLSDDREAPGGGYRLTDVVLHRPELRQQLLLDAKRDLIRFKAKYGQLVELAAVFAAIDETSQELESVPS
jgi:hypothetical protein